MNTTGRFRVLNEFGGAAIFDKETGLVWERSPSTSHFTWLDAHSRCVQLSLGGRLGWRLPAIQELASLVDPNNPTGNPDLPPGHPFLTVQSSYYWSSTTTGTASSDAWVVRFDAGAVDTQQKINFDDVFVWCVRGGEGLDTQ